MYYSEPGFWFTIVGLSILLGMLIYLGKSIYRVYTLHELRRLKTSLLALMCAIIAFCAAFVQLGYRHPVYLGFALVSVVVAVSYAWKAWEIYKTIYCSECFESESESSDKKHSWIKKILRWSRRHGA